MATEGPREGFTLGKEESAKEFKAPPSMALPPAGLTKDQEIRVKAINAAALSDSGNNFHTPTSLLISKAAEIEKYIREGVK